VCFHFHSSPSESSSSENSSSENSPSKCSPSESSDDDDTSESESFVPLEIQHELKKYLVEKLVPDIMIYLSEKMSTICGIPTEHYHLEALVYPPFFLRSAFKKKEDLYDLYKMTRIFQLPHPRYFKYRAQVSVGAAIRISRAIGKEEHAVSLNQIVEECFTPEENPDLTETLQRKIHMHWLEYYII